MVAHEIPSWEACGDVCAEKYGCEIWNYDTKSKICILRSDREYRESKSGFMSGTKECPGIS